MQLLCVFYLKYIPQVERYTFRCTDGRCVSIRPVPRAGHRKGKIAVGVCSVRLRRRGVFHQAVGKGLRERRLCDDPQFCPEI